MIPLLSSFRPKFSKPLTHIYALSRYLPIQFTVTWVGIVHNECGALCFYSYIQSRSKTFASLHRPKLHHTGIFHEGSFSNSNKISVNIASIEYRTIDFFLAHLPSKFTFAIHKSFQVKGTSVQSGTIDLGFLNVLTVFTQIFIFQGRSDCREAHLSTGSRGVRPLPHPLSQFVPPNSKTTYPPLSRLIIQATFSGKPSLSTRFHHHPPQ